MNNVWSSFEQIMNKSRTNCEQAIDIDSSWKKNNKIMNKLGIYIMSK